MSDHVQRNTQLEITTSEKTKEHISHTLHLDSLVFDKFFTNIEFALNIKNIIHKCKTAIEEKDVNPKEIDRLFNQLDSIVRQDIFRCFSDKNKLIYSFKEKTLKFRRHFDIANNTNLKIRKFSEDLPVKLEQQTFIRQLIDIEDIELVDIDLIEDFTRLRLMLENNLSSWVSEGELTSEEIRVFEEDIFRQWKMEHRAAFRNKDNPDEHIDIAHKVLTAMRRKELSISGQKLLSDMSHGELYSLSNKPIIGWTNDWEKYENEN